MAAWINTLYEEGTRMEIIKWIQRERELLKLPKIEEDTWYNTSKDDLLAELSLLWEQELALKKIENSF